jgi:hypothetical protein
MSDKSGSKYPFHVHMGSRSNAGLIALRATLGAAKRYAASESKLIPCVFTIYDEGGNCVATYKTGQLVE